MSSVEDTRTRTCIDMNRQKQWIFLITKNILVPWFSTMLWMSVLCGVCHVFPPPVSIFGLFPVLVRCHYELILVQPCLSNYLWFTCVFIVLSVQFDFVWSTRYSPVFLSMSVMPCHALPCLDVIKDYYLSLRPRLRVPVPPSCVHRDRRPDLNRKRRPFTPFFFRFSKVFCFVLVCLSRGKEVATRPPALAHCRTAWEFGGIAASAASPLAASPHARRSREISASGCGYPKPTGWLSGSRVAAPPGALFVGDHATGSPLTQARRIAADSCPPDCRWLKPTGLALTHARWPPLSLALWIKSTCHGQECRVSVLLCPQEHFKTILLVLSMETRLGQAAPWFVATEAIPAACLPVVEMEGVAEGPCEGHWLLVMPRGSLSFQASPGGLLVPVGCPVLFVWPWSLVLSCHVLFCVSSPGGLLIPPDFPREIFWGGRRGSGCRGRAEGTEAKAPEDHLPWPPELPAPPWPPELPAPPWPPELPAPPWSLSVCSALEVPVLCSCPCLSWGAFRAPTPPPRWNCEGSGWAFREGGGSNVSPLSCVSCVPASCVHIWFVSCPRQMSLWVNPCPAVFV